MKGHDNMSKFLYKPKFMYIDEILNLVALIAARVDVLTIQNGMEQNPKLRRSNLIKTIHSSLAIENNSLSLDQVTAILDGKRILLHHRILLRFKTLIRYMSGYWNLTLTI